MFWHLRQLFLNLFIIYEKHILNYSGGVFKGVFKGVHFQNEKCDCIKYLKLVDPVCGSGHCHIVPYWADKLNKEGIVAYQASRRGGTLYCRILGDSVFLSGKAALFSECVLYIDLA